VRVPELDLSEAEFSHRGREKAGFLNEHEIKQVAIALNANSVNLTDTVGFYEETAALNIGLGNLALLNGDAETADSLLESASINLGHANWLRRHVKTGGYPNIRVIIPAAGFGTRLLPATKAVPKEMLPVVDKPVIQYVVEEAVASGVRNIVIVTGKPAIEDHFDAPTADLVRNLEEGGKHNLLERINIISVMASFIYMRQRGLYGNGTPVLSAESSIHDDFFAVLWGDEFMDSTPPRLAQMLEVHKKYGGAVIAAVKVPEDDLSSYGVPEVERVKGNVYRVRKLVEKPKLGEAPSNLASIGGYILPREIFDILRNQEPGTGGEIYLPEAIAQLIDTGYPVHACEIQNGTWYDTGTRARYIKTVISMALRDPELGPELRTYIKETI
jgi:UTP--glucose-1-phosphate uridylyltransferase